MPYSESGVGRSLPLAKSGVEIVSIDGIVPSEILVPDDAAAKVVQVITDSAKTGKIGDGKIFMSNVEEVIRIRTGEKGADAI